MTPIQVPVKNKDGETKLEDWNPQGQQSDGSVWNRPVALVDPNHEHTFTLHPQNNRMVMCQCGFGGMIHPHRSRFINGHIWDLDGRQVI